MDLQEERRIEDQKFKKNEIKNEKFQKGKRNMTLNAFYQVLAQKVFEPMGEKPLG